MPLRRLPKIDFPVLLVVFQKLQKQVDKGKMNKKGSSVQNRVLGR